MEQTNKETNKQSKKQTEMANVKINGANQQTKKQINKATKQQKNMHTVPKIMNKHAKCQDAIWNRCKDM